MLTIRNNSFAAPQPRPVRRLTIAFLGLSLIAGCLGSLQAQNTNLSPLPAFFATNTTPVPTNPPLPGGGNGWTPFPNGGVTLAHNDTICFAFQNDEDLNKSKYFRIEIQTTRVNDIQCLANEDKGARDSAGVAFAKKQITYNGGGFRAGANANERYDEWIFTPCPAWEWVSYKNTCNHPITISSVRAGSTCASVRPSFRSLLAQGLRFGAPGPGAMVTNEFINQVMVFPQTIAIDTLAPMTFSAPTNSGNWTASPIYMDPFGNPAPLGGVLYTSDGTGLNPSMLCDFSFSMQGPADLQYSMYAYDNVMAEFQEFNLNLRPTLTISQGTSAVELDFNSVPGLNYVLLGSPDLQTWSPLQTFSGTGGIVTVQTPMNGPTGFFRLGCQPATLPGNPPVVGAITADALSNALTIVFSEPVDSSTAANPANYFVGSTLGGTITESPLQVRPDAVTLMLNTPLMPGVNYYLGVTGVSDTNGNVMVPATFPFAAATLQTPCAGGELLVRQAYSECNPDGFWHVVEDDYYACPPDGAVQKFRVADTKTTQPCASNTPSPVGLLYPTAADVASTCQSPILLGQITIYECVGGLWSASTYLKYQCLDGTIYLSGPIANVPVNPPTGCTQPPPGPGTH
jgi:hypothetical protein